MHCSAVHFIVLHCAPALKQHTHTLPGSRLLAKPCTKLSATWEESLKLNIYIYIYIDIYINIYIYVC